jgi:hypothetical protein
VLQLWRHCLLPVLLCWAASLALAFGVLILTLVPWLRAPAISHAAVYPVLFVIFARAAELATVLGLPVGFAVGARRLLCRRPLWGTNSLFRWQRALMVTCVLGAALCTLGLASVNAWSLAPGRMARSALNRARERCFDETTSSVPIPVLGATWICGTSHSPRLEGRLPGSNQRVSFSAGNVQISDDLLSVDLEDFRLGVRSTAQTPEFRLRTPHATVHGVRSTFRRASLGPWQRAMVSALTGLLLGGLATYLILVRRWCERKSSWLLAFFPALASAATYMGVDHSASNMPAAYLGVPLVGVAVLFVIERLLRNKSA